MKGSELSRQTAQLDEASTEDFVEALEARLSPEGLAQSIADLAQATMTRGSGKEVREVPDWKTRAEGIKLAISILHPEDDIQRAKKARQNELPQENEENPLEEIIESFKSDPDYFKAFIFTLRCQENEKEREEEIDYLERRVGLGVSG